MNPERGDAARRAAWPGGAGVRRAHATAGRRPRAGAHGELGPRRCVVHAGDRPGHDGRGTPRPEELFQEFVAFRESSGSRSSRPPGAATSSAGCRARPRAAARSACSPTATSRRASRSTCSGTGAVAAGPAGWRHDRCAAGARVYSRAAPSGGRRCRSSTRSGDAGGRADAPAAMTQAWVDEFAAASRQHPQDWHMLQKVLGLADRAAGDRMSRIAPSGRCGSASSARTPRRARRRPVPRPRPGRGADRPRAHVPCWRPPTTTPRSRVHHRGRAGGPRALQRRGRADDLRPGRRARRRWLAEGEFDVLHLHEPVTPSLSLLALWPPTGPIVATFHTAILRSRPLSALRRCCSRRWRRSPPGSRCPRARRTHVEHLGGDAVVIPNGVYVAGSARGAAAARLPARRPTIAFLGRLDEARKGLPVLLDALRAARADGPARGSSSPAGATTDRRCARGGRRRGAPSSSSARSPTTTRRPCWLGRRVLRAANRRRELRHRARRGDERRRGRRRQRPRRVPRVLDGAGRRAVPHRRRGRAGRDARPRCSTTRPRGPARRRATRRPPSTTGRPWPTRCSGLRVVAVGAPTRARGPSGARCSLLGCGRQG